MVDGVPIAIIMGILLGFLSGLGTGGGSLLILWLTAVMQMDPVTARSINLMFYIPSALTAILFRKQRGRLPIQDILPAVIPGCIAAGVLSMISAKVDTEMLKRIFGILLLLVGAKEILYRPRKAK